MGRSKHQRNKDENFFLSRIRVLEAVFLIILLLLGGRLVYLQIFRHSYYMSMADQNHFVRKELPSQRGTIYDRNGNVLALDILTKTLYVDTRQIAETDKEHAIKTISAILGMPEKTLRQKFEEAYPLVKRKVSISEFTELEKQNLKGLVFEDDFQRVYPKERTACHVVGCVDVDGKGIEGVEYYYDKFLAGRKGIIEWLRDGKGTYLTTLGKVISKSEKGTDVYLTLDERIQAIAEEEIAKGWDKFQPKKISVVVLDPNTGEVLALANRPDYDPNQAGKFPAEFRKNYAVCDSFEPGSIFKILTASAVLEEKKAKLTDPVFCENGKWYVNGHYLHDAHPEGTLDFEKVIVKSSNIGTVKFAMKLGEEKLYDYTQKFRIGKLTNIDMPGETTGKLRPLSEWTPFSITAIPIGQEVSVSCLQIVRTMSVLANGGYLVRPHVMKRICLPGKPKETEAIREGPILSGDTVSQMDGVLLKVVSEEGTAALAQIGGYDICGKTGTAQKFEQGHFSHTKFTASFVGFLPLQKPQVAIVVSVDEPKGVYYGGAVAGPIFREIAWRTMQYINVPPDNQEQHIALSSNKK